MLGCRSLALVEIRSMRRILIVGLAASLLAGSRLEAAPHKRPGLHGLRSAEVDPCNEPELWPLHLRSARLPLMVHYAEPEHEPAARTVLRHLERAWRFEIRRLGFRPPVRDRGSCGPDGALDVFLWRGLGEAYVAFGSEEPRTAWDDARVYLVVDPWGPYGGAALASTLAHELNHVLQAADDWWEHPAAFEMTAQFVEWLVAGNEEVYRTVLADFQARPGWSLDYNDGYRTWYMYGAALYLHFLRDRYFEGDTSFLAEMWRLSRNPPGAEDDAFLNEPDFEDALDELLLPLGLRFVDTVPELARWRWFTGRHDDGLHFQGGVRIPPVAVAARLRIGLHRRVVQLAPMALGSAYVVVGRTPEGPEEIAVSLELPPASRAMRWVVQAVPGPDGETDGETLDLRSGAALVRLGARGVRTLIVTALSDEDPDERDVLPDRRYPVRLRIEPR
jgi:hypothetical protein